MSTLESLWLVLWALYALESYDYAKSGEVALAEGLAGFRPVEGRLGLKHFFPGHRYFTFDVHAMRWDAEGLKSRLEDFNKTTRWLRAGSQVLFIMLFVVMPGLYLQIENRPHHFVGGLAASLALWWFCAAMLFYADRRLNKADGVARLQRLLHALLAPGFALRATESLSREHLKAWHPLAASAILVAPAGFEALCLRAWLDHVYRAEALPRLPEAWLPKPADEATFKAWLERQGLALARLSAPPTPMQAESRAFCPRCLSQFTQAQGSCNDCGLELKAF